MEEKIKELEKEIRRYKDSYYFTGEDFYWQSAKNLEEQLEELRKRKEENKTNKTEKK